MKIRPQLERRRPQTKKYDISVERIGHYRQILGARDFGKEFVAPPREVDLSRKTGVVQLKEGRIIEAMHAIICQGFGDRHNIATCGSRSEEITVRRAVDKIRFKAENTLDKPSRV